MFTKAVEICYVITLIIENNEDKHTTQHSIHTYKHNRCVDLNLISLGTPYEGSNLHTQGLSKCV